MRWYLYRTHIIMNKEPNPIPSHRYHHPESTTVILKNWQGAQRLVLFIAGYGVDVETCCISFLFVLLYFKKIIGNFRSRSNGDLVTVSREEKNMGWSIFKDDWCRRSPGEFLEYLWYIISRVPWRRFLFIYLICLMKNNLMSSLEILCYHVYKNYTNQLMIAGT